MITVALQVGMQVQFTFNGMAGFAGTIEALTEDNPGGCLIVRGTDGITYGVAESWVTRILSA